MNLPDALYHLMLSALQCLAYCPLPPLDMSMLYPSIPGFLFSVLCLVPPLLVVLSSPLFLVLPWGVCALLRLRALQHILPCPLLRKICTVPHVLMVPVPSPYLDSPGTGTVPIRWIQILKQSTFAWIFAY
jgi:hypothetical protein